MDIIKKIIAERQCKQLQKLLKEQKQIKNMAFEMLSKLNSINVTPKIKEND